MGTATVKHVVNRPVEIRVRFEPGLGSALYASLRDGEVALMTVARMLGRGRALLYFRGFTLMAHGAPEWRAGESFEVAVKELGPPLVLAPVGAANAGAAGRVIQVDSAVVPGTVRETGTDVRS